MLRSFKGIHGERPERHIEASQASEESQVNLSKRISASVPSSPFLLLLGIDRGSAAGNSVLNPIRRVSVGSI